MLDERLAPSLHYQRAMVNIDVSDLAAVCGGAALRDCTRAESIRQEDRVGTYRDTGAMLGGLAAGGAAAFATPFAAVPAGMAGMFAGAYYADKYARRHVESQMGCRSTAPR
ncbi:MAG TPA: hypothetical protein VIV11_05230 [Kofleriaceae bacterium]